MKKSTKKSDNKRTLAKYDSVADFFTNASKKEMKEVFSEIMEGAIKDQQKIVDEYDKKFPK